MSKVSMEPDQLHHCPDHARVNKELPLVEDFGFDSREKAILDIIRHLSCGLVVSAYDGAGKAQERADLEWTEEGGHRIVKAVAYLLARLQAIRTVAFEFIVVDCPCCRKHICQSELQLLLLLRAGRRNDPYRLAEAAKLVAASGEPSGLMIASRTLGSVLKDCDKYMLSAGNRTLH
ncbi:MAG: hypothetical protein MPJ78_09755 [Hyphomicrobiaceae bacterium]|nr:hypothetical protein [Hyphomicrobiaceae bacterium]